LLLPKGGNAITSAVMSVCPSVCEQD